VEWIFVAILTVSIIHVIEEYMGGFVDQMKQFVPGTDLSQFVSINMTFIVLCFIAVIVGSSNLVGGSIRLRGYNAGLVTAVVLYLPFLSMRTIIFGTMDH